MSAETSPTEKRSVAYSSSHSETGWEKVPAARLPEQKNKKHHLFTSQL